MAPLLWTHLVGSLTRQIWSHLPRCSPSRSAAVPLFHRCLSGVSCTAMLPRAGLAWLARTPLTARGPLSQLALTQPAAGMKTRTALKRRCKDCFFVRRRGRLFVYCKTNPRHKQRQG